MSESQYFYFKNIDFPTFLGKLPPGFPYNGRLHRSAALYFVEIAETALFPSPRPDKFDVFFLSLQSVILLNQRDKASLPPQYKFRIFCSRIILSC